MLVKELFNKDQTIKWNDPKKNGDGKVMFNGQDVSEEIQLMIEAFQIQDAEKMGFIFSDTLYQHLKRNGKNVPRL